MQEFSSVTASSYDAEALAPMLTEKASQGWSVVGIVSAGTNVVAYLTRGGAAQDASADATTVSDTEAMPVYTESASQETQYVAAAPAAEVTAEPVAEVPSWETVDVADEVTAITPTLPNETVTPISEPEPVVDQTAAAEAAAAVVATGEPVGWGASADAVASAGEQAGATVSGVGDTASSYTTGASEVIGGVSEQAGAAVGGFVDSGSATAMGGGVEAATTVGSGIAETVGGAGNGVADTAAAAYEVTESTPAVETVVETVPESSGVPAGWYADPSGRFELRYWDGNAWTEHVSRAGQQYTDPPVA